MIQYKNLNPVNLEMLCAIEKVEGSYKKKALGKDMQYHDVDTIGYAIGFRLIGGSMQWVFDTDKERDFVFDNVIKNIEIEKLDNF